MDDLGSPLLCDFGLAIIAEELGELPISSVLQGSGNCRWMSREMLFGNDPPSKGCDIWAFGMVVIEVRLICILAVCKTKCNDANTKGERRF